MWQPGNAAGPPAWTADQVYMRWQAGEIALLDVREPDEWDEGHIPGATHIPLGDLPDRYEELDPGRQWVAYCHVGGRSAQAADFLAAMDLPQIANLLGGMAAWEGRGYPVE